MTVLCKIALEEATECGKTVCCQFCDKNETCENVCGRVGECADMENLADQQLTELQIMQQQVPAVLSKITELTLQAKKIEEDVKAMKDKLLQAMTDNNIKKFENEQIRFTYIAPTTKTTFDSKSFKNEHPEMDLSKYEKTSAVKGYVQIKVK